MDILLKHQFNIIFQDKDLIAVSKPSGLLTIQDGFHPEIPNLRTVLKELYGEIYTVHRLDKLTSGIVLFARNAATHRDLSIQFSDRKIEKTYLAVVHGFPIWQNKIIDQPLKVNGDRSHRTVISLIEGKKAATLVKCLIKSETYTLLEIKPKTGYSHQIRAHLSASGFPVVGDKLYCRTSSIAKADNISSSFFYLHSKSISFFHSGINEMLSLNTDIPDYFEQFIHDQIRIY